MSVMAMVLAAGMVMGDGTGAGRASGETRCQQSLDLRGEWVGMTRNYRGGIFEADLSRDGSKVRIDIFWRGQWVTTDVLEIIDEGKGHLRVRLDRNKRTLLGLYEQHGDRVAFCYGEGENERPLSIKQPGNILLILHRVKPAK